MFLKDTNASSINNSIFFNRIHYLLEVDWILFHNKICSLEITFMLFQNIAADRIDRINTMPKINAAETFFLDQMAHNLHTTKRYNIPNFSISEKLTVHCESNSGALPSVMPGNNYYECFCG